MEVNNCRNCGAKLKPGQKICVSCGFEPLNGDQYCQQCGLETKKGQKICVNCGFELILALENAPNNVKSKSASQDDDSDILLAILSAFIPIVGLILYIVFKDDKPHKANTIGKGAIIGLIIYSLILLSTY